MKKRLSLYIDNKLVKRLKVPRKVNVGRELFLGGLPSSVAGSEVSGWHACSSPATGTDEETFV